MIPAIPFAAKFGLAFVPLRVWLILIFLAAFGYFVWNYTDMKKTLKDIRRAVQVEQNRVDGNKELVEQLSAEDDEIMHQQMMNAEKSGAKAKSWLRRQDPNSLKNGYTPKGYAETINEVH